MESNGTRLGWLRNQKTRSRVGRKASWVVGGQEPDSKLRDSNREQTKGRRFGGLPWTPEEVDIYIVPEGRRESVKNARSS